MSIDYLPIRRFWCPKCEEFIEPKSKYRLLPRYKILSYVLCLCGGCLLPYAIPSFKEKNYYCPKCHQWVNAVHRRRKSTIVTALNKVLDPSGTNPRENSTENKRIIFGDETTTIISSYIRPRKSISETTVRDLDMGSSVKCALCGKIITYRPAHVDALGEHLLINHPDSSITHFSVTNIKRRISLESRKKHIHKQNMYKTTVETWRPGTSSLKCEACGKSGPPLIRKQRNKVAQSSLGALCLLGCWPLCFLPFILGGSNVMNLYCKHCGEFLGTYDRKTGRLQSEDFLNVKISNFCNCSEL